MSLQRAAGNQAVARLLQRTMTFSPGATYLDTEQGDGPFPPIYEAVQARAKQLEPNVEVRELTDESVPERAHYTFDPGENRAAIEVRPRRYAGDGDAAEEQELSGIYTAVVHETQHALDDLEDTSALKGKVAERGGAKPVDASMSAVYERMMSELNAHAVQAAQAREVRASGRTLPLADELLADSFTMADFEPPGGAMFRKLVEYAKRYTGATNQKVAEQQVTELLFLNWGDIEALVAKSQKDPGRIGLSDPDEVAHTRPAGTDDEDVEEIVVS